MLTKRITVMKLRSHEILTHSKPNNTPKASSRLKKFFQGKHLFKKKFSSINPNAPSSQTDRLHAIPDYVRKSILRYLLEPSPPIVQSNSPSRNVRPPLMGIQALKNKKQHSRHQSKRSLRPRVQPVSTIEQTKSPDDYQTQNNYDMTILHSNMDDDIDDNSIFATKTSTHQKKTIPQWARKNELQIAICNQIYFHRNPSEIFGNSVDCSPAHLRTILHSMLPNVQLLDDDRSTSSSIPFNSNKSILV